MVRVINQGQTIQCISQYALLRKLHLIILYLPLEGDAVFTNNYPMYACNFTQFIYLSVLYHLPFCTSYTQDIHIWYERF